MQVLNGLTAVHMCGERKQVLNRKTTVHIGGQHKQVLRGQTTDNILIHSLYCHCFLKGVTTFKHETYGHMMLATIFV